MPRPGGSPSACLATSPSRATVGCCSSAAATAPTRCSASGSSTPQRGMSPCWSTRRRRSRSKTRSSRTRSGPGGNEPGSRRPASSPTLSTTSAEEPASASAVRCSSLRWRPAGSLASGGHDRCSTLASARMATASSTFPATSCVSPSWMTMAAMRSVIEASSPPPSPMSASAGPSSSPPRRCSAAGVTGGAPVVIRCWLPGSTSHWSTGGGSPIRPCQARHRTRSATRWPVRRTPRSGCSSSISTVSGARSTGTRTADSSTWPTCCGRPITTRCWFARRGNSGRCRSPNSTRPRCR